MRILAIETTEQIGSLAAFDGDRLLAEADLPADRRTAAAIGPSVVALLAEANWQPADVELLAVTTGPGSFTGLRIGTTFAKTFAYAIAAEVIGCDTLAAIAVAVPPVERTLWVATNAQRQQVFARPFFADPDGLWTPERPTEILDNDVWLSLLDHNSIVAGDALARLADELPAGVELAEKSSWRPLARNLAQLAWRDYQRGRRDDLWKLAPQYYRKSYAEEKEERAQEAR